MALTNKERICLKEAARALSRLATCEKRIDENDTLPEIMAKTARFHITLALQQTNGNKTEAAKILGMPSYQTLHNWMKKYGVSDLTGVRNKRCTY